MKQILGDNQFFGINHNDIEKGNKTKEQFRTNESITDFIKGSIGLGLNGFMLNSNDRGFKIVSEIQLNDATEVHYSIPYPHKFATMVNESGMLHLLQYVLANSTINSLLRQSPKFIFSRNIKHLLPLIIDLEIPNKLKKGSYVYLQNIVTDLILGLKREDLLFEYCRIIQEKGFKPGLITLNPTLLEKHVTSYPIDLQKDMIICFNINKTGFNVFPSREKVESFIYNKHEFKKMGMSILSSGGVNNIKDSLDYIKKLGLDYVVYGSSKITNIEDNFKSLQIIN
tara:strand:+ start:13177 stop:14025 length:849 start_codon:yes stop_codon:yes gene_type:complete